MKKFIFRLRLPGWNAIPLPDQVKRLIIIFVIIISGYFIIRQQFVPETFGELGHYRTAAVDSAASLPISYMGESSCVESCHSDVYELKSQSYHSGVSCEVCHGPAAKHGEEDPETYKLTQPKERGFCPLCHNYDASKPTGFPQIDPRIHNPVEPCMNCHNPHDPKPPHVPEECSACHGVIARTKAVSHHTAVPCTRCHEAPDEHNVNPRAFIPSKPQNRSFCGGCHSFDADSPKEIPRIDLETHEIGYLCWQCHYPHYPEK